MSSFIAGDPLFPEQRGRCQICAPFPRPPSYKRSESKSIASEARCIAGMTVELDDVLRISNEQLCFAGRLIMPVSMLCRQSEQAAGGHENSRLL